MPNDIIPVSWRQDHSASNYWQFVTEQEVPAGSTVSIRVGHGASSFLHVADKVYRGTEWNDGQVLNQVLSRTGFVGIDIGGANFWEPTVSATDEGEGASHLVWRDSNIEVKIHRAPF